MQLPWLGPQPSGSPSIRLADAKSETYVEIQLTEDRGIVPNRVRVGSKNKDSSDILLAGESVRSISTYKAPYAGQMGRNENWRGDVEFPAMLPTGLPAAANQKITTVRNAFSRLERVQWLAASRPGTSDIVRPSRCCRPDGADLPSILLDRKDIVELASTWLSGASSLGEAVSVGKDAGGVPRLEFRRTGNEALPIHLSGEGAHWLLPILFSACWAELATTDGPTMLAIEELEARLHPNLQIAVLERLLKTITAGIPCVLETHSIYLLRRAQLAVANGEIAPEDLAIYWVERDGHAARVRQIKVESDGALVGWNPETFEEEQQLSRQIFEARWKV